MGTSQNQSTCSLAIVCRTARTIALTGCSPRLINIVRKFSPRPNGRHDQVLPPSRLWTRRAIIIGPVHTFANARPSYNRRDVSARFSWGDLAWTSKRSCDDDDDDDGSIFKLIAITAGRTQSSTTDETSLHWIHIPPSLSPGWLHNIYNTFSHFWKENKNPPSHRTDNKPRKWNITRETTKNFLPQNYKYARVRARLTNVNLQKEAIKNSIPRILITRRNFAAVILILCRDFSRSLLRAPRAYTFHE